jgi:acyl carrier protein
MIDSLKIIELVEVLEESTGRRVPDDEITEENFSSVSAISRMASRLTEGRA